MLLLPRGAGNKPAKSGIRLLGLALFAVVAFDIPPLATFTAFDFFASSAHAAENAPSRKKNKKNRPVPHMQESTYRRISEVQKLFEAKQHQEALDKLLPMLESRRRYNKNEIAQIHRMAAHNYLAQDIFSKSIEHFEQVIAQVPDITEALENSTLEALSQLYFQEATKVQGEAARALYNKSLRTIKDWISKVDEIGAKPYHFIATIHYQLGDYTKAIENMETAVRLSQEGGHKVKESWWSLLVALHAASDNWDRVVEISEILVKDYPKRVHWMTLAGAYGEIDQEDRQLWTFEVAHAGGYLEKSSDFYNYSGLLLQHNMPNRASKYLQESFDVELTERKPKNLKLLGEAFQLARDYDAAIPILLEASNLEEDGQTLSRLSSLYADRGEYDKCQEAAQNALDKGGLRQPLYTKITLGICLFNMKRLSEARKTFTEVRAEARASEDTATEANTARNWIRYVDSESERLAALASLNR